VTHEQVPMGVKCEMWEWNATSPSQLLCCDGYW